MKRTKNKINEKKLISRLKDEKEDGIIQASIKSLIEMESEFARDEIVKVINNRMLMRNTRVVAIDLLVNLQGKDAVPLLVELLDENDFHTKKKIFYVLVDLEPETVKPYLINEVEEEERHINLAMELLAKLDNKEALPLIRKRKENCKYKASAEKAIFILEGAKGKKEWIKELNDYLFSEIAVNREDILKLLFSLKISCSEVFPELYQEIQKSKNKEKQKIIEKTPLNEAGPILLDLMQPSNPQIIRFFAMRAIAVFNPKLIFKVYKHQWYDFLEVIANNESDINIRILIYSFLYYYNDLPLDNDFSFDSENFRTALNDLITSKHFTKLNMKIMFPLFTKIINFDIRNNWKYWGGYGLSESISKILGEMKNKDALPKIIEIYKIGGDQYERGIDYEEKRDMYGRLRANVFKDILKLYDKTVNEIIISALYDHYTHNLAVEACEKFKVKEARSSLLEIRIKYHYEYNIKCVDRALASIGIQMDDEKTFLIFDMIYSENPKYGLNKTYNESFPEYSKSEVIWLFETFINEFKNSEFFSGMFSHNWFEMFDHYKILELENNNNLIELFTEESERKIAKEFLEKLSNFLKKN